MLSFRSSADACELGGRRKKDGTQSPRIKLPNMSLRALLVSCACESVGDDLALNCQQLDFKYPSGFDMKPNPFATDKIIIMFLMNVQ